MSIYSGHATDEEIRQANIEIETKAALANQVDDVGYQLGENFKGAITPVDSQPVKSVFNEVRKKIVNAGRVLGL